MLDKGGVGLSPLDYLDGFGFTSRSAFANMDFAMFSKSFSVTTRSESCGESRGFTRRRVGNFRLSVIGSHLQFCVLAFQLGHKRIEETFYTQFAF